MNPDGNERSNKPFATGPHGRAPAPTQRLKSSLGRPFWLGFILGSAVSFAYFAASDALNDPFARTLFGGLSIIVFGPVGGCVFQVTHDLIIARRSKLLGAWDYTIFAAIGAALVVAGLGLYFDPGKGSAINVFKSRTFDIAAAAVFGLVVIYELVDKLGPYFMRRAPQASPVNRMPGSVRRIVAVVFPLLFLQGMFASSRVIVSNNVGSARSWLHLVFAALLGVIGVAFGIALGSGKSWALWWVRLILGISVVGGFLGFVVPLIAPQMHPPQVLSSGVVTNWIVSAVLLVLLSWRRRSKGQDSSNT